MTVAELPTPAILVDVDRVERNVRRMADKARDAGVDVRPHFKTSKLLEVVQMQLSAGAIGMTCATDDELKALQAGGVESILWAYQPVGRSKLDLTVAANRTSEVMVAVDSVPVGAALGARAAEAGQVVRCLIELDTGMRRCGVQPADALGLALALREAPGISIVGLMTHEGHVHRHVGDPGALVEAARSASDAIVSAHRSCLDAGIAMEVVSVGSTPAAWLAPFSRGVNEVRPGTYAFNDANQVALGGVDWDDCAVTVLATVVSRNHAGRAVVDAGLKELSGDGSVTGSGHGRVIDIGATLTEVYEEHGVVEGGTASELEVGDLVQIVPNHVCGAVNMWSDVTAVRAGTVIGEWCTTGRR